MIDVRYLLVYAGSATRGRICFNDDQAAAFNELVIQGAVTTTLGHTTPTTSQRTCTS